MKRRVLARGMLGALAGSVLLVACEQQTFESIDGLTVVAVEVDPPTANPGQTVSLDLTYVDPKRVLGSVAEADAGMSPADETPIQVAWFGGCHNPPRESATGCLPLLGEAAAAGVELLSGADPEEVDPELVSQLGFGTHFEMQIPEGSVAARQRRPDLVPFGLSYAFFAVCRGELSLLPEARERLPVGCLDGDGNEVDESDFVIGFSTVFVFDEIESERPKVTGAKLAGERVEVASCSMEADCSELGDELAYTCVKSRCVPKVSPCRGDCSPVSFAPLVGEDASELDPATVSIGDTPKHEMVWVKYYAFGRLDRLESLIIDRDGAMRDGFAAEWTPPPRDGIVVPLFAVVQDSRGGTTPVRIDVAVRD